MGAIGGHNPIPTHVGGRTAPAEKVWRALRRALGSRIDGRDVAGPVDGIEDTWRQAKARAIAKVQQLEELAVTQAFPDRATSALDSYERALGVPRAPTDQQRREAAGVAYTAALDAVVPDLRSELQRIDPGLDVAALSSATSTWTHFGKAFAARPTDDFIAGRNSASFPNYSQQFVLVVRWSGAPNGVPAPATRALVERLLCTALPSWCDFSIENGSGFYLDGFNDSALDITSFD